MFSADRERMHWEGLISIQNKKWIPNLRPRWKKYIYITVRVNFKFVSHHCFTKESKRSVARMSHMFFMHQKQTNITLWTQGVNWRYIKRLEYVVTGIYWIFTWHKWKSNYSTLTSIAVNVLKIIFLISLEKYSRKTFDRFSFFVQNYMI